MLQGVIPSKTFLGGIKVMGISENHPSVIRILEILRKKEASGDITADELKEFYVLNDELNAAYEFIHGKKIYPSGEIDSYPRMPSREQIVAAVNYFFERDENEAGATSERHAVLWKQVTPILPTLREQVRPQGMGDGPWSWVVLAQAVGMDEGHPALRRVLEMLGAKITWTWKESHAAMNALLGTMEEAWEKKNSHP
jgi:hypothetical protein